MSVYYLLVDYYVYFETDPADIRILFFFLLLTTQLQYIEDSTLVDWFGAHGMTKCSSRKSKSNPWFTSTLRAFKSTVRRAENIWKRTHLLSIGLHSNLFATAITTLF